MQKVLAENFVISNGSKGYYCFFCGFYFDEVLGHINNPAHQFNKELPDKKSLIAENGLSSRPTFYYCNWCSAKLTTSEIVRQHVHGKKHVFNQSKHPLGWNCANQSRGNSQVNTQSPVEAKKVKELVSSQNTDQSSHVKTPNGKKILRSTNYEANWKGPVCKPGETIASSSLHNHTSNTQGKTSSRNICYAPPSYSSPQGLACVREVKTDVKAKKKKYIPPIKLQKQNKQADPANGAEANVVHSVKSNKDDTENKLSSKRVTTIESDEENHSSLIQETKKLTLCHQRANSSKQLELDYSDGNSTDGEDSVPLSQVQNGTLEEKLEPVMLNFHFQYYFDNLRHKRKNIRNTGLRSYRCGPCNCDFDELIDAFHHSSMESHKVKLEKNPGTEHYYCKICQVYLTKDETLLQCHLLYHMHKNSSTLDYDILNFNCNAKKKARIECMLCGPMKNEKVLAEHVKSFDHRQRLNSMVIPRNSTSLAESVKRADDSCLVSWSYDPYADICIKNYCYICYKPGTFNPGSNMQKIKERRITPAAKGPSPHEKTHCTKNVEGGTNFFRCFLCDKPFETHNMLKSHYSEPHHSHRLQTLLANLDECTDSEESDSSWATTDGDYSDTQKETCQRKYQEKPAKDGSCSEKRVKGCKKSANSEKVRDEKSPCKQVRQKKPRVRSKVNFPYNESLLKFGSSHVSKCLEPGADNIYNGVFEMTPTIQRGIDLIYPFKTGKICLVCDYTIPNQFQYLIEHLYHEVHLENLKSLEDCRTMTEDKYTHLDLAEFCMKEKIDGESIDCLACGFPIRDSDDVIEAHIASQQHIVKLQHWKMSTDVLKLQVSDIIKDSWYFAQKFYCQLCQCVLNKEAVFVDHLEAPQHLKMVEQSKEKNNINICYVCSLCWYGSPNYSHHFCNEQHKRAMKRRTGMLPKMNYDSRFLLASAEKKVEKLIKESDTVIQNQKDKEIALLRDIEDTVKSKYPLARAYMFGSRISYLCSAKSDADVFLDCENIYNEVGSKQKSQNYIKSVRNLFISNKASPSANLWKKVLVLISPRVPIIRLQHVNTGLNCDLSFLNGLSTEKSKLIRNYILADERCRKLILFLKQWIKECVLYGPRAINCYALSWYVIFFMQVQGIFPSVDQLKIKDEAVIIDGWQCHYSEEVPTQPSDATFRDLLMGFFAYYAKFDYQTSVVCPLIGKVIKKALFTNFDNLPVEMETYKNRMKTEEMEIFRYDSPMCIQDPVDLTQNITKAVYKLQLRSFKSYCSESYEELNRQG